MPCEITTLGARSAICAHPNFSAQCDVIRLTDGDSGPVTGFLLEVHVACAECAAPFRFRLPYGLDISGSGKACMSVDGRELRVSIFPPDPAAN